MDYGKSIEFLCGLRQTGIKLGLRNIALLLSDLDHPQKQFVTLHVAGTNGKGSTASGLAAILSAAGYRTGLYTSPHLQSFNERIRIDGETVSDPEVTELVAEVRKRTPGRSATFFEFATAMAFLCFEHRRVDFAVVETGMGGRLDATVLVSPLASLITPISLDHTNYLGTSLARIAAEKASVIKKQRPVIIGAQPPEVLAVLLNRVSATASPLRLWERDFGVVSKGRTFSYRGRGSVLDDLRPSLPGEHQHANLAMSLCAAEVVREAGYPVSESAMRRGVEQVRWPGRLEWWPNLPRVLLDGAHNAAGAEVLAQYLETEGIDGIHWVVGIKWDKDVQAILAPLLPRSKALYCTVAAGETFIPPNQLAEESIRRGVPAEVFPDPQSAFRMAVKKRQGGETILIAGSLYIVGAVRDVLDKMEMKP
ncbi:MAG: bifunctional folylpolyglutamate synthase/dihydrofolate synthase [Desulfuromonadaceae bacterium]|nr:bifunctional folylpolyglutamate synthase/dihydrofolate synthase [Desulfuromonadaceae bacterium]